ncbi:MAG: DivIVA domain-containing protein [Clostridia bacterium]|nr:DivIVA domain-containing protein [Clostridia bacterium]
MLKTEQILNAKFTPVSKGTYSAEEVDAFLKVVAESYDQTQNEKSELIKKISILADKIESYRNDEEAIKLSLLDAHKMAESINRSSKEKSQALIADAEEKAAQIKAAADYTCTQEINEAREQAKAIVDNAKTAVSALTERAQAETQKSIIAAQQKAKEIVDEANARSSEIIGNSKSAFLYYSSELEKIKTETDKYKATIAALCNNQLGLINSIPEVEYDASAIGAIAVEEAEPVEEPAAEEIDEIAEEAEEIIEPAEEIIEEAAEETFEEAVEEAAEETVEEAAEEVVEDAAEPEEEIKEEATGSLEDLLDFLNSSDDEAIEIEDIASDLDDFLPELNADAEDADIPVADEAADDDDDDDDFTFDPNSLDGIVFDDNKDEETDEDITSLFGSLFDE